MRKRIDSAIILEGIFLSGRNTRMDRWIVQDHWNLCHVVDEFSSNWCRPVLNDHRLKECNRFYLIVLPDVWSLFRRHPTDKPPRRRDFSCGQDRWRKDTCWNDRVRRHRQLSEDVEGLSRFRIIFHWEIQLGFDWLHQNQWIHRSTDIRLRRQTTKNRVLLA